MFSTHIGCNQLSKYNVTYRRSARAVKMSHEEELKRLRLPESVQQLHEAITQKHPINGAEFDAWYANRSLVFERLEALSRSIAKNLREDLGFSWQKHVSGHLWALLEAKHVAPRNWEDAPDGALAGMAMLLAAWVANQATAKTRDDPQDAAKELFQNHVRPLILASMDLGIELAVDEEKA